MTNETSMAIITAGLLAATVLFMLNAPSAAQGKAVTTASFPRRRSKTKKANQRKRPRPRARLPNGLLRREQLRM